jgi:guanylate kinase
MTTGREKGDSPHLPERPEGCLAQMGTVPFFPMTTVSRSRGKVVVVSGPSGAGKTTLLRLVRQRNPVPLVFSVSATTRPPRPEEIDGVDYHFLSAETFESLRKGGGFLECYEVFGRGTWYGTLQSEVVSGLEAGKWVVLNIDVHGAAAVMDRYPDAVTIFVRPSSMTELQRRLRERGTETEEAIQRRLNEAEHELTMIGRYRYEVINDDVQQAVAQICAILTENMETDQHA